MNNVRVRAHLSLHANETSAISHWQIPEAHFLEAWSDARAFDGTVSIVQPLIAPLYGGRSAHEVLATLSDRPERSAYQIVREYWQKQRGSDEFESFWRRTVHDGVMANTALPARTVAPAGSIAAFAAAPAAASGIEISFRPDPTVLRRSVQQQRMAAGAPEATHAPDMG